MKFVSIKRGEMDFSNITHLVVGPIFNEKIIKEFSKLSAHLRFQTYIIAVDGGADLCRESALIPDEYFGDDDSISAEGLEFLRIHEVKRSVFPPDKDFSDFAAVIGVLAEKEANRVLVAGMSGGRLDQQLAVIGEGRAAGLARLVFFGENEYIEVLTSGHVPHVCRVEEESFSVLGLTETIRVSISGAKWNLFEKELPQLSSFGLSNVGPATITLHEGSALVIINRD